MSRRDDRVRLADMLEHARLAIDLAGGRSADDYITDRHMRAGVERYIEIIGEAARNVSEAARGNFPGIPWEQIVGTRHIIAHGYDQVRPDILWEIVHEHLPALVAALERFLAGEG